MTLVAAPLRGPLVAAVAITAACAVSSLRAATDTWKSIDAATLLPLTPRSRPFVITDGEREGTSVALSLRATDGDRWQLTLGDIVSLRLERGADGSLLVHRIDMPEERKAVAFGSPVVLIPGHVRPNVQIRERTHARVIDTKTGEVTRDGPLTHVLHDALMKTFHTPAGAYEGVLVRIDETLNVDMAEVRIDFAAGFVPGRGVIFAELTYTVDKLAWFGTTKAHTAELAESLPSG